MRHVSSLSSLALVVTCWAASVSAQQPPAAPPAGQPSPATPVAPATPVETTPAAPPPNANNPTPAAPGAVAPAPAPAPAPAAASQTAPAQAPPTGPVRYVLPEPRLEPVHDEGTGERALRDPLFSVQGNIDALWSLDPTYDLFSDRDVRGRVGVSVSTDLLQLDRGVWLVPELGWGAEGIEEDNLYAVGLSSAELRAHSFYGALALRYALLDWLHPQLRAQGGVSLVDIELEGIDGDTYDTGGSSPFVGAGAGVMVLTPKGRIARTLQLGLLAEGGYVLASAVDVDLELEDGSGRIPVRGASLGEWSRSGPYARFSAVARF